MLRAIIHWLSRSDRFCSLVQSRPFTKTASRFVAGSTLSQALKVTKQLNDTSMYTTIDFLGEHALSERDSTAAAKTYNRILQQIHQTGSKAQISLKLTQLGLLINEKLCLEHLTTIARTAAKYHNTVEIDMEDSSTTDRTIQLYTEALKKHRNVVLCVQAYLYRTEHDVKKLLASGASLRLVKGAYREPKEIAYPQKSKVDKNYRKLILYMFQQVTHQKIYIATHDEMIIEFVRSRLTIYPQLHKNIEFEFLHGVRRDLQKNLAKNYNVRIYLPYGKKWCPYLMRRMAERPANLWFVIRHLRKP